MRYRDISFLGIGRKLTGSLRKNSQRKLRTSTSTTTSLPSQLHPSASGRCSYAVLWGYTSRFFLCTPWFVEQMLPQLLRSWVRLECTMDFSRLNQRFACRELFIYCTNTNKNHSHLGAYIILWGESQGIYLAIWALIIGYFPW